MYDHPARFGPRPSTAFAVRRLLAGWTPQAVVVACGGEFSVRTAYRWRKAILSIETVRVGAYEADFVIRRKGTPIRVTAWTTTEAAA